ncbi:hypothetical protein QYM36_002796 [Artemia franciscana]|uniref:Uncharacterized protein n=1 Tax=Artemia franciscana TaxID=6661 RepID=A0AA88I1W9_ARTSF|nr:hypothetical protein QYM36_002796 [Artemia franciscana]
MVFILEDYTNLLKLYDCIAKILHTEEPNDMILDEFFKEVLIKLNAVKHEKKFLLPILDFNHLISQHVHLFDCSDNQIPYSSKRFLSGVPDGSVLVPNLSDVFVNDPPFAISSKLTLYAHRSKLVRRAT